MDGERSDVVCHTWVVAVARMWWMWGPGRLLRASVDRCPIALEDSCPLGMGVGEGEEVEPRHISSVCLVIGLS